MQLGITEKNEEGNLSSSRRNAGRGQIYSGREGAGKGARFGKSSQQRSRESGSPLLAMSKAGR